MTKVFFIRHAKAGDRARWTDPDHLRPLTKAGWRQAEALVDQLASDQIARILSSHYVRCMQTVEPLARARSLEVTHHPALVEGAPKKNSLELIEGATEALALCTHGDVMQNVIGHLQDGGVEGADDTLGKKGATWVLTVDGGRVSKAVYLPPPA
ncbi:MAG: phosphoglycerate mutase family protein [Actinomycetota bacterium]